VQGNISTGEAALGLWSAGTSAIYVSVASILKGRLSESEDDSPYGRANQQSVNRSESLEILLGETRLPKSSAQTITGPGLAIEPNSPCC